MRLAEGWAGWHARVQWIAVVVGRECCVRLFKSLKRLKSLLSLRCYAQSGIIWQRLVLYKLS